MTRMLARVQDRAWIEAERDKALRERFIAERTYAVIQDIYYRRYPESQVTAEYHAAANPYLKAAMADAKWYGDKATMLAAVLTSMGGGS